VSVLRSLARRNSVGHGLESGLSANSISQKA
jgi:hypothetical protein